MRKMLQNKKGFTLVELMIVVVIMGILVAVAVPVYNTVTKNARTKSCKANISTISTNLSQYQMTGNNGEDFTWTALATKFNGSTGYADYDAAFTNLFQDGMPFCPVLNTDGSGAAYSIVVTAPAAGSNNPGTIAIRCTTDDSDANTDHNA